MSQLEVDKIIPQSGTTLTIGDSGDTISFAEGTNLGIDTNTLVIDSTNNRVGIKNASPTVELDVIGDVKVAGNINLGDNNKARFGTGNDLEIYHDGSNSYIKDVGTGNLSIQSDGAEIQISKTPFEHMIRAKSDGSVDLYYDNSLKLATTSTGVDVTGTVVSDGVEVDGNLDAVDSTDINKKVRIVHDGTTGKISSATYGTGMDDLIVEAENLRFETGLIGQTERMRIDSSGNVGIGTSSPTDKLNIHAPNSQLRLTDTDDSTYVQFSQSAGKLVIRQNTLLADHLTIDSSGNVGIGTSSPTNTLQVTGNIYATTTVRANGGNSASSPNIAVDGGTGMFKPTGNTLAFSTTNTERMRIDSSGSILVNNTATPHSQNTVGCFKIYGTGEASYITGLTSVARYGGAPILANRVFDDGTVIEIYQAGAQEGTISVSGTTVSYNGFTGTHWSRLSDNSKPTILKGTILESLDEMMDWYQVQFTVVDEEDSSKTYEFKESYVLGEGESVGDVITYNYKGTDYSATIIQEGDVKHTKSKISDTVDAKNVYGVFVAWDNDDDTVNDMYVAQTGTFVVRMNSAETVSKGDLIQSNGDGTGKVQVDDIIRASTVAKVLSTTKIETYEDGSYIVPCSLHC